MPAWALAAVLLLTAACASPPRESGSAKSAPARARDFRSSDLRQPALFVRVVLATPGAFSDRDRSTLPAAYQGALLEGLNARAVLPRDAQLVTEGKLDARVALARAREVGADHAVLVDVQVERGEPIFCREGRRPFRTAAETWAPALQVLRVSDGSTQLALSGGALAMTDLEPDCDDPRASQRRSREETLTESVNRLLRRLLGS